MNAVQNYVDKHHTLLCKFGGLAAIIFLTIFVPFNIITESNKKIEKQQQENYMLISEINDMKNNMSFYKEAYAKQASIQKEVTCLARNIYFEAASEPKAGKIAVAEVTMNRVKHGYANSVCGVVMQKSKNVCQFSWVCEPKKAIASHADWKESKEIAENILISKKKYSTIQGALFFHADYVDPSWAKTKDFVRKVGKHLFYRE